MTFIHCSSIVDTCDYSLRTKNSFPDRSGVVQELWTVPQPFCDRSYRCQTVVLTVQLPQERKSKCAEMVF